MSAALIGAFAGRRGRKLQSADYAQIAAAMSQQVADDVRVDKEKMEARFEAKVDQLQSSVDHLRSRVDLLTDTVWAAIRRLELAGVDATDIRHVVVNGRDPHS